MGKDILCKQDTQAVHRTDSAKPQCSAKHVVLNALDKYLIMSALLSLSSDMNSGSYALGCMET